MGLDALLVGFDPCFERELKEALLLHGISSVQTAQDVHRAAAAMEQAPDLLITELILLGGDGICLLEEKTEHTVAVVSSTIADPFFYAQAASFGAADCIARPVPAYRLASRGMQALAKRDAPNRKNRIYAAPNPMQSEFLYDARLQKLLLGLSLPVTLDGFSYLRFCTLACLREPALLRQLTKVLYPMAAKEFAVSPASVERSMRYAVEHIFDCARLEMLDRCFGASADPSKGKLSVGAFLAQMVQLVQCEI